VLTRGGTGFEPGVPFFFHFLECTRVLVNTCIVLYLHIMVVVKKWCVLWSLSFVPLVLMTWTPTYKLFSKTRQIVL
jgi:hypothetical protein